MVCAQQNDIDTNEKQSDFPLLAASAPLPSRTLICIIDDPLQWEHTYAISKHNLTAPHGARTSFQSSSKSNIKLCPKHSKQIVLAPCVFTLIKFPAFHL